MHTITEISIALLLLLAAAIRSLRFAPSRLTIFELQRQAEQGDGLAKAELQLRRVRTELLALRQVIELVCIAAIALLLNSLLTSWQAMLGVMAALLLVELLGNTPLIERLSQKIAAKRLPSILTLAKAWHPLLKLLAGRHPDASHAAAFYSKDELLHMVEHDHGILHPAEQALVQRALTYQHIKIKDIMTPRASVVSLDKNDSLGPLVLDNLHKSGQNRFPVIVKDLNHVIGTINMADLLPLRAEVKHPSDVMSHKVYYLAENFGIDHAIAAFLQTGASLFIVVNELEETKGVISIETVFEQIVGKSNSHDFDRYEDRRAVVQAATALRHRS
ncbi:MAG TPA: CBS domain-containing protein [Candidatus Acidoferrum sp.]|nr:CBS domain-containing protein [Candidatus Acidoferrum sp.]